MSLQAMLIGMNAGKRSQRWLGLMVGLGWGAVWGLLVPVTPLVSLDGQSRDWMIKLQPKGPVPEAVVILASDGQIAGKPPEFYLEPYTYAVLVERLIRDAGARVVLLTLPGSFNKPHGLGDDDYDAPLRTVINRYNTQIVLEAVPANRKLDVFNNLLIVDANLDYRVPPEQIVGARQFLADADDIVRHTQSQVNLFKNDSTELQYFFSADFLAVRKFLGRSARAIGPRERIHFFDNKAFKAYPIEGICPPDPFEGCGPLPDAAILQPFKGKLVIVGATGDQAEVIREQTPVGLLDGLHLHANILGNLLQNRTDRVPPPLVDLCLILGFGVLSGLAIGHVYARILAPALLAGYALLTLVCLWQQPSLLLPVVPPLAAFVFTGNTLFYLRRRALIRERLDQQEEELNRLRRAEREAILNQAKKLLFRVATDIHDRPLQELKLVMDSLETLLYALPPGPEAQSVDAALAALQKVGREIRTELNDLREVAAKLEITPALKNGLHAGLHFELDRLVAAGDLQLQVERQIEPLHEPTADSSWLDAREDLFRFFKEAMTNALRHAQAKGATRLRVGLKQLKGKAEMVIENDGPALGTTATGGGYGTKVMNTIAHGLPAGHWERSSLPGGGVRVLLIWQMNRVVEPAKSSFGE